MKPNISKPCVHCGQPFTAKPCYEEAEQDGKPDVFQGYQNTCRPCLDNPNSEIPKDKLDALRLYCVGLLTKDELISKL